MCIYESILSSRHELQPARLLCPWNSSGKNTGVGCHFPLQWIFLAQWSYLRLLSLFIGRQIYTTPLWKPSCVYVHVHANLLQSYQTPCNPVDCNPPGPLSMRFSRQASWSVLLCPPPEYLSHTGIKPVFLASPALEGGFLTTRTAWEACMYIWHSLN